MKVRAWCCDVGAAKSAAILPAGKCSAMCGRDFLALIRGEALRGDEGKGRQQEGEVGRGTKEQRGRSGDFCEERRRRA